MRYLMLILSQEGQKPSEALMEAMGPLTQSELATGGMIDTGGLAPSAKGARVKLAGGKVTTTDGPFTETKEVIGGFAIYECADDEAARKKAVDFMDLHRRLAPGWEGVCEVRPIAFLASVDMQAHC